MSKAKKAAPKKKASTALAVRAKAKAPAKTKAPEVVITGMQPVGQLGEIATVGALGLAELRLTSAEEQVLARAVDPGLIQFKPAKRDGPPIIPYLPHIVYTRWFNEAFGRTGWSIVPTAAPKKVDNLLLVPYLLYIHGVPVAAATGEQEYIESNKQQTYGDVIESTVASALRRCAKRLGVGLEMWDKGWLKVHAIPPHERGQRRGAAPARDERDDAIEAQTWPTDTVAEREAEGRPVLAGFVTRQQLDRLTEIAERRGRAPAEVSLYLRRVFGVQRANQLKAADYAEVCRALEARGDLPMPGDGQ